MRRMCATNACWPSPTCASCRDHDRTDVFAAGADFCQEQAALAGAIPKLQAIVERQWLDQVVGFSWTIFSRTCRNFEVVQSHEIHRTTILRAS